MAMKTLAPILAVSVSLAIVGCSSGDSSSSPSAAAGANAAVTRADEPGPKIEVPNGPPPTKLIVRDLKRGSGPPARVGDEVTIQNIGLNWNGSIFSNSWAFDGPPSLVIGDRSLMYGLDRGIRGMRVGGRREVLVPRRFIYYPDVKHHAPVPRVDGMVFLVDLLAIH